MKGSLLSRAGFVVFYSIQPVASFLQTSVVLSNNHKIFNTASYIRTIDKLQSFCVLCAIIALYKNLGIIIGISSEINYAPYICTWVNPISEAPLNLIV